MTIMKTIIIMIIGIVTTLITPWRRVTRPEKWSSATTCAGRSHYRLSSASQASILLDFKTNRRTSNIKSAVHILVLGTWELLKFMITGVWDQDVRDANKFSCPAR